MQDSFKNKIALKEDYQKAFKKLTLQDFRHKFSFFNRFTQIPNPLNGQNSLSLTKVFCQCSLTAAHKFTNGLFQKNPNKNVEDMEFPGVLKK